MPETAAPVVTEAALEAEYEAALAAASAVNNDDGDTSAVNNAADRVAAAAHRRRGARAAFLTGLGEEPDHELYPNYQHERRLRRAGGGLNIQHYLGYANPTRRVRQRMCSMRHPFTHMAAQRSRAAPAPTGPYSPQVRRAR